MPSSGSQGHPEAREENPLDWPFVGVTPDANTGPSPLECYGVISRWCMLIFEPAECCVGHRAAGRLACMRLLSASLPERVDGS